LDIFLVLVGLVHGLSVGLFNPFSNV